MGEQGMEQREVLRYIGLASVARTFPGCRWAFACPHNLVEAELAQAGARPFEPLLFSQKLRQSNRSCRVLCPDGAYHVELPVQFAGLPVSQTQAVNLPATCATASMAIQDMAICLSLLVSRHPDNIANSIRLMTRGSRSETNFLEASI